MLDYYYCYQNQNFANSKFSITPTNSPRLGVLGIFGKLLTRKTQQIKSIILGLYDIF
jgi:hypothetical protein